MIVEQTKTEWILSAVDRCDVCQAQAYILVKGLSGELTFCLHHYSSITSTESGKQKMASFAIQVINESEKLIENRLKDDD